MIRISQFRESHSRTNTSIWRNKSIQKGKTVRVTVWYPSRKVIHLSEIIWDRKIITEFTRSSNSIRIVEAFLMMDVKVSKDKHISRWVDWENIRLNRIKNCIKMKNVEREKRSKTLSEVKPVEKAYWIHQVGRHYHFAHQR